MKKNQNDLSIERRQAARHLLQLCFLPLLAVLVWAGCKQDVKVAADTNPFGTYTLISVDGNKLPYAVKHEGAAPTIKSGTFAINSDGTCSSKVVFSVPPGGDTSREVKASYTPRLKTDHAVGGGWHHHRHSRG